MKWHFYRVLGLVLEALPYALFWRLACLRRLEAWALVGFAVQSSERLLRRNHLPKRGL